MPRVSVVICCYNLGRYLDEALDSVLAQTMQDFEIIVINPSSTDGFTNRLLADYKRPKTRVMHTPFMSVSESRNLGIAKSMGPYICCLDADDILEPTCLEKASRVLDEHREAGFVAYWYRLFGEQTGESRFESCDLYDFLIGNPACSASMYRREVWEKCGGYDKRFAKGFEDWDFWLSILETGYKAHMIREFLFRWRARPDSRDKKAKLRENRDSLAKMFIEKHRDAYQKHAIEVLILKEKMIGDLLEYHRSVLQGEEYIHSELHALKSELAQRNQRIHLREHELRTVCSSKAWKLGCAFRDAKCSLRAAALLPFRIIDLCCPDEIKRGIKRALLLEHHELIRKNFYKFPYRLLDTLVPTRVKMGIPCGLRNAARAIFRTNDERLYRQKRWKGPLVSVIILPGNGARTPDGLVGNLRSQTFSSYEVITPDSGSASAPANAAAPKETPLKAALAAAKGKYLCVVRERMRMHPTYLEKCILMLESRGAELCCSHVDQGGEIWAPTPEDLAVCERVPGGALVRRGLVLRYGDAQEAAPAEGEGAALRLRPEGGAVRCAVVPEPLLKSDRRPTGAEMRHSTHPNAPRTAAPGKRRFRIVDPLVNIVYGEALNPFDTERTNVLFLIPWMTVGGADYLLRGIADALQKHRGFTVSILTTAAPLGSAGNSMADFLTATPYIYQLPPLIEEPLWYPYLEAFIRRRNVRTLFICGASFVYEHLPRLHRAFPGLKIMDQLFNDSTMGHVVNNRRFAGYIDLTLVPAEKIKSSILALYGGDPSKVRSIYHGVDTRIFDPYRFAERDARKRFGVPENRDVILFIGRLAAEKNPMLFLDLAAAFRGEPRYRFLIRAHGPLRDQVAERIQEQHLDNIVLITMLDAGEIPLLYRLARLMVITSLTEGVPITVFESLAMNVPVVASDVGGIADVIRNGVNGCLYPSGNREELIRQTRVALETQWGDLRGEIVLRHELRRVYERYCGVFREISCVQV